MKMKYKTTKIIASRILFVLLGIPAFCQHDKMEGQWEGIFMEQFKVEFHISTNENMGISGKIKMYDGSTMIQNDELNAIKCDNLQITFMIPAKETAFEGKLNDDLSQFSGDFIFPDGSRHPVHVTRKELDNLTSESSPSIPKGILTAEFSPTQLKEDLIFLRGHLSDMHPQYHLYTSEETYDALYQSIIQNLDVGMTLCEYYNLISPVVVKLGCSHTGIRLPEKYINAQRKYNKYFPLKVFVSNEKAWVIGSLDETKYIVPGSEMMRINQVPMENIIARLLSFLPAEGYNNTSKYFELNRDFGSYFNLLNNSEQFQIEYKISANSEILSINVMAVPYESSISGTKSIIQELPIIHPFNKELSTAVMEIKSFAMTNVNEYLHIIDSTFIEIQKEGINNLVIDLRGNQGGHPIFAAILYSFLTSENFTYFQPNEDVPEFKPLYETMEPAENNFNGNCYVLVDGGCLSTTGHLISLLKYHDRAIFIGEEPGSWFYCNDNSRKFYLPNTRIELNIPRTTFMTAVKGFQMGEPFIVDHPLNVSFEDLKSKSDPWLRFTLNLIRTSDGSL
jgi:hypothetical protein